jgi:hypothetical protein
MNIKVVKELVITSIGGGTANNVMNVYNRRLEQDDSLNSKTTFLPANFSGPHYLKELDGKCFDYFSLK